MTSSPAIKQAKRLTGGSPSPPFGPIRQLCRTRSSELLKTAMLSCPRSKIRKNLESKPSVHCVHLPHVVAPVCPGLCGTRSFRNQHAWCSGCAHHHEAQTPKGPHHQPSGTRPVSQTLPSEAKKQYAGVSGGLTKPNKVRRFGPESMESSRPAGVIATVHT